MANLYAELGLSKTATKKQIRDAYRKKAKYAHPDTGGSPEKFALVRRAHDILADDARRAKYDATGDESEAAPDNAHSDVVNCLVYAQEYVLGQIERKSGNPTEFDVIKDMRTFLGDEIAKIDENVRQLNLVKKKVEKLCGRFKTKQKVNYLEISVQQKLSACNEQIEQHGKKKVTLDTARTWLKEYTFDFTAPQSSYGPTSTDGVSWHNMINITTQG